MSELWDFTRISVNQDNLQELKEIWDQWDDETKKLFYPDYGDSHYLLDVKVINTSSKLLPSIGIPPIVASILGRYT
ncbi:hypothetical protein Gotri_007720 [Gossypium trilobum]|uniref:Uncharacterized protein n=1 Tax=Gossypium trilobum TaxID=34281 RepID=A0A7J9EH12_9ROSI|nr:hypothetical protein [Gossypium trilobum]